MTDIRTIINRFQVIKVLLHSKTTPRQRKYLKDILGYFKHILRYLKHILGYFSLVIFWSNKPNVKYFVFTQSRCGSELLNSLLGNHPNILSDGEILNTKKNFKVHSVKRYLTARSRRAIVANKGVYGFKLKLHHLTDYYGLSFDEARAFISSLNEQGWKIIYLRRNNFLRRSLSSLAAQQRGIRHVHGESKRLKKAYVNTDTILNRIKESEKRVELDQKALQSLPHLIIEYEKDLLDQSKHSQTCSKIFEYLDIPEVEVKTTLTRTSTDNLSETIENFSEVKSVLENTKYSDLLTSN